MQLDLGLKLYLALCQGLGLAFTIRAVYCCCLRLGLVLGSVLLVLGVGVSSSRVRLDGGITVRTVVMIVSIRGWGAVRVVHPGHVTVMATGVVMGDIHRMQLHITRQNTWFGPCSGAC